MEIPPSPECMNTDYDDFARRSLAEDPHYLTSVTRMADRTEVHAGEDIYAVGGVKLVAKDTPIGSRWRDSLLSHKLMKPIDLSLVIGDGVTPEFLAQESARLIATYPYLQQLVSRSGDELAMRHGLARLALPPQMAFKLTVAREQQASLFHHLLIVALIARYLALGMEMSERDTANLLTAALCHDLGELHTDPAFLDRRHRIGDRERRYVYVHPITGYLITREMGEVDPAVSTAILQHQERLDGSGYPYGRRADEIGLLARIVGVADVCAAMLVRFGNDDRLSMLMRLNLAKYDGRLLALLQNGFSHPATPAAAPFAAPQVQLVAAARLLSNWGEFRAGLAGAENGELPPGLQFLFERMSRLRTLLLQFGFDTDSLESLMELARSDAAIAAELAAALGEVNWQFADLAREIERRGEIIASSLSADEARLLEAWVEQLGAYAKTVEVR